MTRKEIVANCIFFAILILIGAGLFFNFRYIFSLEQQVYQRDSLIRELSFSDQLVREYFDIKEDSLNHSRSYTLKDDKKTRIVERQDHIVEIDGKEYNFDQFFDEYIKLVNKYNSLVNEFNALYREQERTNKALLDCTRSVKISYSTADSLRTLLQEKDYYLNRISREYGIICRTQRQGNTITYSMSRSPQLDSALLIYPYFRDQAVFHEDTRTWEISIPSKKRIETVVRVHIVDSKQ